MNDLSKDLNTLARRLAKLERDPITRIAARNYNAMLRKAKALQNYPKFKQNLIPQQ